MPKTSGLVLRIDIHGLTVEDALYDVRELLQKAPVNAEKIVVVHGYNNGTRLREAVRTRLHSPRILEICPNFFNEGETVIWLKR